MSAPVKGRLEVPLNPSVPVDDAAVPDPAGLGDVDEAEMVGHCEPGAEGDVIEAMVVAVAAQSVAAPAAVGTMANEATAKLEVMIRRLAHMMVALLSVEAPPLRSPTRPPATADDWISP